MKFIPNFKDEAAPLASLIRKEACSFEDATALIANALGAAYAKGGIAACEMVKAELLERRAS